MRLEISVVDRHDLEASAYQTEGWIEIRIANVIGVPVPLIQPKETLLLIIVPEKRGPMAY